MKENKNKSSISNAAKATSSRDKTSIYPAGSKSSKSKVADCKDCNNCTE
jgi:hypothetical protein